MGQKRTWVRFGLGLAFCALWSTTAHATSATADGQAGRHFPPEISADGYATIRVVVGISTLLLLIWLGSLPRMRRLEQALGMRQIVSTGLLFALLGWAAAQPAVGVLNARVLADLTPLMHFALGWMGFLIGYQFDVRILDRMPSTVARVVAVESVLLFAFVSLTAAGVLYLALGSSGQTPWLREALTLGTAGAITVTRIRDRRGPYHEYEDQDLTDRIDSLDEVVAVAGLSVIASFFRPRGIWFRWDLPGTVWLVLSVGLGTSGGLLICAMLRGRMSGSELLTLVLGSVGVLAGAAGYLYMPPLVVCFFAGAVVANVPAERRERMWAVLVQFERPLYYLLLTVAGALWNPRDLLAWLLLPVFVAARALALWCAAAWGRRLAQRGEELPGRREAIHAPVSIVSIVIAVSVQSLYRGPGVTWVVTAVLGAALLFELLPRMGRSSDGPKAGMS